MDIDTSKNLFVTQKELLAMPPLATPGEPLPKGVKTFGLMPDYLKSPYSAIVRVSAERVSIDKKIKALAKKLPKSDGNPVRDIRRWMSSDTEVIFDEICQYKYDDKRLEHLSTALMALFFSEIEQYFPDMPDGRLRVSDKWEIAISEPDQPPSA